MSDGVTIALIGAVTALVPSLIGALWAVFRYFLDREDRIESETRKTLTAKDEEIRELRAQVRELERETWPRSRR